MASRNLERLRARLRRASGEHSSYVLDNLAKVVPDYDPGEHRLGKMYVETVEALFCDSGGAEAITIGTRLAKCSPREPCGLVFCPRCRKKKQDEVAAEAISTFGQVPHDRLRFLTIVHSLQESLDAIPESFRRFRKQLTNAFTAHAADTRVFGYLEVDLKTPDMFNGAYQTTRGVIVDHRPHAKALLRGLGLDLDAPLSKPKFYLPHLHAIADLGTMARNLNSESVLKRSFPHPYQIRVTPLWPEKARSEDDHRFATVEQSLHRISGYMLKFKLQFADDIFADDLGKPTMSKYKEAYPPGDIVAFCKLAQSAYNFKLFKYRYNC